MIGKEVEWIVSEEKINGFENKSFSGVVIDKVRATSLVGGRYYNVDFYMIELPDGLVTYIRPIQVNKIINSKPKLT